MRTNFFTFSKFFSGRIWNTIITIITLLAFVAIFIKDSNYAFLSLIFFAVFLLIILGRIYYVTEKFLHQKNPQGVEKLYTSVKYFTRDGIMIEYEIKKIIQCKQIIMDKHEHEYFWTGSKPPIISSESMRYEKTVEGENGFKKAVFKYKEPLLFNAGFVAHIKMELDDSDKTSNTHIGQAVKEKLQLISFNVQLLYKKGNVPDAKLSRRLINTPNHPYETIKAVPFQNKTLSYEYDLYNPEVGYIYKIEWVR